MHAQLNKRTNMFDNNNANADPRMRAPITKEVIYDGVSHLVQVDFFSETITVSHRPDYQGIKHRDVFDLNGNLIEGRYDVDGCWKEIINSPQNEYQLGCRHPEFQDVIIYASNQGLLGENNDLAEN